MSESLKPCPFCGGKAMFLTIGMTELFQAASVVVASIRKNEISHLQEQMAKVHTEFEKACEAVS